MPRDILGDDAYPKAQCPISHRLCLYLQLHLTASPLYTMMEGRQLLAASRLTYHSVLKWLAGGLEPPLYMHTSVSSCGMASSSASDATPEREWQQRVQSMFRCSV